MSTNSFLLRVTKKVIGQSEGLAKEEDGLIEHVSKQ